MYIKTNKRHRSKHNATTNDTNVDTAITNQSVSNLLPTAPKIHWYNIVFTSQNMQLVVNVMVLVVSIVALLIANDSFKYTSSQNSNIVENLNKIQAITEQQTKIIGQQLQISNQIYYDQLNSGIPKIVIKSIELNDPRYVNGKYAPAIDVAVKNEGKRYAYNFSHRISIKEINSVDIRSSPFKKSINIIGPGQEITFGFKPQLDSINPFPFYCCVEITYWDNTIGKNIYSASFYEYIKDRDKYDFFACDDTTVQKMKIFLNTAFKAKKWQLIQ